MPNSTSRARHRAPGRITTPLDDLARTLTDGATQSGRRYGAAVLASGLVLGHGAPTSTAPTDHSATAGLSVDVAALAAPARRALATSPVVVVAADAAWTFTSPALTITENPKPVPPPPPPAPSRSAARAPIGGAAQASAVGSAVIEIAAQYVGTPYVYGGTTPEGFDCSGFTSYVYAQLGVTLSRTSAAPRYDGVQVPRDQAQPGDLVWSPGHIGIYAGGDTMIDSPRPGKSVQFRQMWQSDPVFIRVSG